MYRSIRTLFCFAALVSLGLAALAYPIQARDGELVELWTYNGGDGEVFGDTSYFPKGKSWARGVLVLPGLKREDVEPYRISPFQTILHVKSTDRCLMVFHYFTSGEDDGNGVYAVRFAGGGVPFTTARGMPTQAEWGIKYLPRFAGMKSLALDTDGSFPRDDLRHLASLRSLKKLRLTGPAVDDETLRLIAGHPLYELHIENSPVTDAGLSTLKDQSQLYSLSLMRTQVTGAALAALDELPQLMSLDLSGSPIATVQALTRFPQLQSITLNGTTLDDSAIPALTQLAVYRLVLTGTLITREGANRLWSSKPGVMSVTFPSRDLDIEFGRRQVQFTNDPMPRTAALARLLRDGGEIEVLDGMSIRRLQAGDALTERSRVKRVALQPSVRSDDDLAALAPVGCDYVLPPGVVDLEGTPIIGTGFRDWRNSVEEFRLNRTNVNDDGLKWLSRLRSQKLRLDRTRVTDAGIRWLGSHVWVLTLNDTATGDTTLENLARFGGGANLLELEMDGTRVTDEGLKHVEVFRALRRLSLKRTKVTAAGVSLVKRLRPRCLVAVDEE